eukprot:799809-Pyramimonas_sp.AAC.1
MSPLAHRLVKLGLLFSELRAAFFDRRAGRPPAAPPAPPPRVLSARQGRGALRNSKTSARGCKRCALPK